MKQLRIRTLPNCENCEDEGRVEVMHLNSVGEPEYSMEACECTVTNYNAVPVTVLSLMSEIKLQTRVMAEIAARPLSKMTFWHGRIISTTRPSPALKYG